MPDALNYARYLLQEAFKNAAAVAWKKALSYFLNKVAYDAAVYIGSGGKGQKPLFITDPGKYLQQVADGAAGEFLDQSYRLMFGKSLCSVTFDPAMRVKLGIFAKRTLEPKANCPYKDIRKNLGKVTKMNIDDLIAFQHSFSPRATELGAYLIIMDETYRKIAEAEAKAEFEQKASSFLGVKSLVAGFTKTPSEYILSVAEQTLEASREAEKAYTGRPVADAISIFTNTLVSRLYKTIFEKGVAPKDTERSPTETTGSGVAAAKKYFAELMKPSFRARGPINIIDTLSSCPSEFKAVNNCIIDENFADAVSSRLTVKEALANGSLNGKATFGFDETGQEPAYTNGLPYRSLVVLRKYRIVPSTWEAAALYIKNYVVPAKSFGLQELVDLYDDQKWEHPTLGWVDNPFYHLIDPNWVLKAPENFCQKEGPGEELISDILSEIDSDGDGDIDQDDTPMRTVSRNSYCADERTCIEEDEDGTCRFYGYCAQEKPVWRFHGEACGAQENTCQNFTDADDKDVSYLQSTLNYDTCTPDTAGCRWYCQSQAGQEKDFFCSSREHVYDPARPDYLPLGNQIRLNRKTETCSSGEAGCSEYIPFAPGSNLAANSSFETFTGAPDDGTPDIYETIQPQWRWEVDNGETEAVSQPYDGDYAIKTGGVTLSYFLDTLAPVYNKKFSVSYFIKPAADCQGLRVELGGNHGAGGAWRDYVDHDAFPDASLGPGDWTRIVASAQFGRADLTPPDPQPEANPNQVGFKLFIPCAANIDAVQLELSDTTTFAAYDTANQLYLRGKADNLVANPSFSLDNGNDFDTTSTDDNTAALDNQADGWVGTAIDATQGYGDYFSGSGGYQDVPVGFGSRYDVSAWVKAGGGSPITTSCLDAERNVIGQGCNLNADAADPRTEQEYDSGDWSFVTFGVEADNPNAAFIRINLSAGQADQVSLSASKNSLACRVDEVGCELYEPEEKGDKVPAVVGPGDYCPAQYAGCKSYLQTPVSNGTDVNLAERNRQEEFTFIAESGRKCDASSVGCEEYTNLDVVAAGGEGLEYYTYIRRCEKPNASCSTYYRWEGDDVRGFELVAEALKGGASQPPDLTDGACGCDPDEPGCTLYYDESGNDYYCPMMKTITCTDNCHQLRNTLDNTIYTAVPEQGIRCSGSQAGCREYRGSTGYNIRRVLSDDFDDGDTAGWEGDVTFSTETLKAGGGSAKVAGAMAIAVNELVEDNKDYMLEFWAKAEGADEVPITARFGPDPAVTFGGTALSRDGNWNHFVLGPAHFVGDPGDEEKLYIEGASFYIDNIVLWETSDHVYVRYKTFEECPPEWVGCSLYWDQKHQKHYLQSFTNLCRFEKVGCTSAIDTHNSTSAFSYTPDDHGVKVEVDNVHAVVSHTKFKCGDEAKGCETMGQPKFDLEGRVTGFKNTYLVNDPDQYSTIHCSEPVLFCDQYTVGGQTGSYAQFKDPNAQTCEFKTGVNIDGVVYDAWFKNETQKFCPVQKYTCVGGNPDIVGDPCFGQSDFMTCGAGSCEAYQASPQPTKVCGPRLQETCRAGYRDGELCKSQGEPTDPAFGCDDPDSDNDGFCTDLTEICYGGLRAGQPCDSDYPDQNDGTYGCGDSGGNNDGYCAERVCQNDDQCVNGQKCTEYWVGKCDSKASGCTEYRDPQDPQPNQVTPEGTCLNDGAVCKIDADCEDSVCVFKGCNAACRLELDSQGEFYAIDSQCLPYPHDDINPPDKLAGCQPYYYLKDSIETATCAGVVNPDEGCLLFNDTTNASLVYDSDRTYARLHTGGNGNPELCAPGGECAADSNSIIQVDRDRVCNQWLYCKTSFEIESQKGKKERLCFDVGNCQEIGSAGQCNKPVGEGQCDNDPSRACLRDADCGLGAKCVLSPKFEHPDASPPDEYLDRLVSLPPHPTDLTFALSEVDQARYYSGYGRIGVSWDCLADPDPDTTCWRDGICEGGERVGLLCRRDQDCPNSVCIDDQCPAAGGLTAEDNICQVVHGYYPTASMQEIGLGVNLPNWNFEYGTEYPWESRNFVQTVPPTKGLDAVIDELDPTRENDVLSVYGINLGEEGARINLDSLISNGQKLVISLKLRSEISNVPLKIQLCYQDDKGACQSFGTIMAQPYWQTFTLPQGEPLIVSGVSGNTYLSIVLANDTAQGDFFVDDVMLQTVLEKKSTHLPPELPADPRFVTRSCRLYPSTNALTCDYSQTFGNTRKIFKGWKGYCLEYDPYNKNVCLQWWPVDVINGESNIFGSEDIVGYFGDAPLFYCAQTTPYEFRRPYIRSRGDCRTRHQYKCDPNYFNAVCDINDHFNPDHCLQWCVPYGLPGIENNADFCTPDKNNIWDPEYHYGAYLPGFWTPFDGTLATTGDYDQFGLGWGAEVLALRCDLVAQAVTPTLDNKAWAARVNGGWAAVWDIGWNYDMDEKPYGSLVPPADNPLRGIEINDPKTWDSDYTTFWGDPFTATGLIGVAHQPIFWLSDKLFSAGEFTWRGPNDHGFNEVDYKDLARAGSPYSCKNGIYNACPDVYDRYRADEQFGGPVAPPPPLYPDSGGLGLKRLQRLFADSFGMWVWGEGRCVDALGKHCTSAVNDPAYPLEGQSCENNTTCNVPAGSCLGRVCEPGEGEGTLVGCGCPDGATCLATQVCQSSRDLCGLGACTQVGDECMGARCVGGTQAGVACSVANNCPQSGANASICTTAGGLTKCVSNTQPNCDCPGLGQCQSYTVCDDDVGGPVCTSDANCNRRCGGVPGGAVCHNNNDCPPDIDCLVVAGACGPTLRQRCSSDTNRTCSIANNCPANFTCDFNGKCTYNNVAQCHCPGAGAWCADGICNLNGDKACATAGNYTGQCGNQGPCLDVDICKLSEERCSCNAGDSCIYEEACNIAGHPPCGDSICEGGNSCCDKICEGGGDRSLKCCDSDVDCIGNDGDGNEVRGQCKVAVCSDGVYRGIGCSDSDFCIGAENGACEEFPGICDGGDNNGAPCQNIGQPGGDCPDGRCADKICSGGLLSGKECREPIMRCVPNDYGNDNYPQGGKCCGGFNCPAPEDCGAAGYCVVIDLDRYCAYIWDPRTPYDPANIKYVTDASGAFEGQYHDEFAAMPQCKDVNGTAPGDARPTAYPNDFCWVQPTVFNIKVNGRSGTTINIPNGSGTVTLTFNSIVDSEQIPIKTIFVNWGDNQVTPVQFFPGAAPRSDPNGPYHTLTHEYVYGDCPIVDGTSVCQIKVWVEDNWGKGNGYCLGGGRDSLVCATDNQCPGGKCLGSCRGGNDDLERCSNENECLPGEDSYCSGIFDGEVVITLD